MFYECWTPYNLVAKHASPERCGGNGKRLEQILRPGNRKVQIRPPEPKWLCWKVFGQSKDPQ